MICYRYVSATVVKSPFSTASSGPSLPHIPAPRAFAPAAPAAWEHSCHRSFYAGSVLSFSFQLQHPLLRQASLITFFWAYPLTPFHQICHITVLCSLHSTTCNHLASSRVFLYIVDHLCITMGTETLAVLLSAVSPGPRVVPGTQWCSVNISWVNK